MGLLLKEGIDINLIKSAFLAFSLIGFLIVLINIFPIFKNRLSNYTLQLAGLIGNTSFLGIPIAIALFPSTTINFTIGFDLGTTLFAWIFGPFFLQEKSQFKKIPTLEGLLNALINSPASRGIIGVLLAYLFQIDEVLGNYLWIPARIVIALAIIIVGSRLGIITNQNERILDLNEEIKFSILLKLFILPFIIFFVCKFFNFNLISIISSNSSGSNTNCNIHNINGRSLWCETKNCFKNSFYYNLNFNNYNSSIKDVYEFIYLVSFEEGNPFKSMNKEYCKDYILITK